MNWLRLAVGAVAFAIVLRREIRRFHWVHSVGRDQ